MQVIEKFKPLEFGENYGEVSESLSEDTTANSLTEKETQENLEPTATLTQIELKSSDAAEEKDSPSGENLAETFATVIETDSRDKRRSSAFYHCIASPYLDIMKIALP